MSSQTYTDMGGMHSIYTDLSIWAVKVVDDDVPDTLVSDTTKPANPQYTHTLSSSDVPVSQFAVTYCVWFGIYGKNNDVATRTMNCQPTIDGVEVSSTQSSASPTTAAPFWRYFAMIGAQTVTVGSVVGMKMWASVANQVDYRGITLFITPKGVSSAYGVTAFEEPVGDVVLAGALPGVTYSVGVVRGTIPIDSNAPQSQAFVTLFQTIIGRNQQRGYIANAALSANIAASAVLINLTTSLKGRVWYIV